MESSVIGCSWLKELKRTVRAAIVPHQGATLSTEGGKIRGGMYFVVFTFLALFRSNFFLEQTPIGTFFVLIFFAQRISNLLPLVTYFATFSHLLRTDEKRMYHETRPKGSSRQNPKTINSFLEGKAKGKDAAFNAFCSRITQVIRVLSEQSDLIVHWRARRTFIYVISFHTIV